MSLVDFFIVGTQKGGTSALDTYLRRHRDVRMADRKEVHHFDDDGRDWSAPQSGALHAHFEWSSRDVIRGESTPIYMYWPNAMERLARYNPAAKLIVGLRHPVHRAYSHWRMETTRGAEALPFGEAISDRGRARVAAAPGGVHRVYSYVERGFYAAQIERLLTLFPRQNIHVYRTDQLWLSPQETLADVERFLGIAPDISRSATASYVVSVDSRAIGRMPAQHLAALQPVFAEDITLTSSLSGIDLSDWLENYDEPDALG